ncbi:MAG TPA: 23S rRNA (adenine(2503)-C(2))-methyltransferase RlmN [Acidobacteriota bacterium]
MSHGRSNLLGLGRSELERLAEKHGLPAYRGRQLYGWLYLKAVTDFDRMHTLPAAWREALKRSHVVRWPELVERQCSADGTEKLLLELEDGRRVEAVAIPKPERRTYCISTQVGCAMGCRFCRTAQMGLDRNLSVGEIVGQVLVLQSLFGAEPSRKNIVLMGMGEPLANFDNVARALELLSDPEGLGFPPRRVTLSTVGLVPGIEKLARLERRPKLAVSISATTDAARAELMPIDRRYPLAALFATLRRYPLGPRERITFEYVLLAGINDSDEDAWRLVRLLHGIRAKVNLIPFNPAAELPFEPAPPERQEAFQRILRSAGVTATIRESRGRDILGACGQLAALKPKQTAQVQVAAP